MTHLKTGDKIPEFNANNEEGIEFGNEMFLGKKLILFFYPKDNTPGCTKEACSLRDGYKLLQENGFEILGISPDSESTHKKFKEKFSFPFSLLADTEKKMLKDYGVWGLKKFMGREYLGVHRTSFIVDERGYIKHVITKVKTNDHAQQILDLEL